MELVNQFEALKTVVQGQINRLGQWAGSLGLMPAGGGAQAISRQLMGSLGQLTNAVGTALGALSSLAMILVLGLFIAGEPRLYERGLAWMVPLASRDRFYRMVREIARTLRLLMAGRLLGMAFEGVFMWLTLSLIGGAHGAGARRHHRHPRLPAQYRLDRLGRAGDPGRLLGRGGHRLLGDRRLSRGADDRRLYRRADGGAPIGRSSPALVLGAQLLFGALFGIIGPGAGRTPSSR